MSIKGWVVHRVNQLFTRVDLPPRAPADPRPGLSPLGQALTRHADARREPGVRATGAHDTLPSPRQLGAYAPLVEAIRDELERFVATHVRMHVAIAEHDRFLLTSIEVECTADDDSRELLERFMREFKPKQIKLFLANEVIARLLNASAIDLGHFGGLNAAARGDAAQADEAYGELLAELRRTEPRAGQRPYQVSLKGRWTEVDAAAAGGKDREKGMGGSVAAPRTPLAGRSLDVEIEDAGGSRRLTLPAIVAGRRYAIGTGEGCDIVVNGRYTSRRHCEIWLDKGAWWVTDSASTNGIRVESASSVQGRSGPNAGGSGGAAVIEVFPGARIVLSGLARGEAADYPRLLLRIPVDRGVQPTPPVPAAQPLTTPATPIVAARLRASGLIVAVRMASGERTADVPVEPLPFRIGRSRNQALVIDWAHEGVSGHHADIVELYEGGARVAVHGDNGVTVAGVLHAPGTQFRWNVGEKMELGRVIGRETECTLMLSRRP